MGGDKEWKVVGDHISDHSVINEIRKISKICKEFNTEKHAGDGGGLSMEGEYVWDGEDDSYISDLCVWLDGGPLAEMREMGEILDLVNNSDVLFSPSVKTSRNRS